MEELKLYSEWCKILEGEQGVKVLDDDGGRLLYRENKFNVPLTREEAGKYFCMNTIMGMVKIKE